MNNSFVSIHVLRAVAAMLVLFAHLWTPFSMMGVKFPNFIEGAAGVDLFFVISGFVMVYSSEKFFGQPGGSARFLGHRLSRIVPLYWVASTIRLIQILKAHVFSISDLSWPFIVLCYLFYPAARPSGSFSPLLGVGWTLNFEMFFYVIFTIAVLFRRRMAVLFAVVTLSALSIGGSLELFPQPLAYLTAYPFLWEFIYGILIAFAYRESLRLTPLISVTLTVAGAIFYVWTCTLHASGEIAEFREIFWGIPAACVITGLTLSQIPAQTKFWMPLVVIGEASYALYLTHTITLDMLYFHLARKIHVANYPWIYAVFEFTVAILIAIGIHFYIEKPMTRFLRSKFRYQRKSGEVAHVEG